MGGDSSKDDIKKINMNEWINVGSENGIDILKSNMGAGEAELRVIPLDPKHEIDKQYQIYSYRKNTNSPLVKCLGAEFTKSANKTMCGNQQNASVLTERIPKTLSNVGRLSMPQSLYVLSESLRGFEDLQTKAGLFEITDKMIGFNRDNKAKVWLNQNFAQNHPDHERPILQTTSTNYQDIFRGSLSQQKMVDTVISLVEQKTESGRLPQELKSKLKNNNFTFQDAFNTVQNYIKGGSVFVPNKISGMSGFHQQLGSMQNQSGWNQQSVQQIVPISASTRVQTYKPPTQVAQNVQDNTNRFTYVSDQNNTGGSYTNSYQVNPVSYGHFSQPAVYERPVSYTFAGNQPNTSFSTLYPQPQTQKQTVNFSNGNTYGVTRVQTPFQIGGINQRIVEPTRISSPRTGGISFNYKSPTNVQFRQY